MRDNFTNKPVTMAALRKSVYPSPIWHAHLSNGDSLRMSFNCPGNTPPEEMLARARFQAADFIRWTGSNPGHGQVWREKPYPRDLRIKRLYLEDRRRPTVASGWNDSCRVGYGWIAAGENLDPWGDHSAASFKRPRVTVKQVKAMLGDVLELVNGAGDNPKARATMEQAAQMLAA